MGNLGSLGGVRGRHCGFMVFGGFLGLLWGNGDGGERSIFLN